MTRISIAQPDLPKSVSSSTPGGNGLTSQILALLEKTKGNDIDLGTVIRTISGRSHAALLVFLSFPLCIPVGIPVLSTTLGLTLGLVGYLLAVKCDLWIPRFIASKIIPYTKLAYVTQRLLRISALIERWFHPRMVSLATGRRIVRCHGVFVLILGLVAAIPLPLPFNNFVAAFPILMLGLSLLEKDGVLVIVSYISAIPCLIYYGALLYLGHSGFEHFLEFFSV